tara:strand:- start:778 stop:1407 length:630 start_codon:yes stop_codon:yes gene_type:complete
MKKINVYVSMRSSDSPTYLERRDAISHDWIKFYESNLIIPILVPNAFDKIEKFLNNFPAKGLILTNGDDIEKNMKRKNTENRLIRYSIKKNIPIFGFCRGLQMINYYFGGSVKRIEKNSHSDKTQKIDIIDNLYNSIKYKNFTTKCYHDYAITEKTLSKSLIPFAISKDGYVEGAYHKSLPIIGVQWHPERQKRKINNIILNHWKKLCT